MNDILIFLLVIVGVGVIADIATTQIDAKIAILKNEIEVLKREKAFLVEQLERIT